jgi:hypothetical protein
MKIRADGTLDIHYVPPLRDLLKLQGRFVVELAKLREAPAEEFGDDDLREVEIRARENGIKSIRKLIDKRRMMEP